MVDFSKCNRYIAFWICQNMLWQSSNIWGSFKSSYTPGSYMPWFWILQSSECTRVTQGSKCLNLAENVWIYDNRQSFEYVSYST